MRAAKVDDNQAAIVSAMRKAGASVQSLATIGKGCPDLLVGYALKTALVECKDGNKPPSQQKLTPDQVVWHAAWKGDTLVIVRSVEEALLLLKTMKDVT